MRRKILIIEDNCIHLDALCKLVDQINQDICIYAAGKLSEAFEIAMEQHIHLFLVDIILNTSSPGDVSGLDFVREIRDIKKYQYTPVIFITSLEDPKLYSYSQLHCYGYIEKPFDSEQVKKIVSEALNFPQKSDQERFVYFRKDGIIYSVCVDEIIFVESSRRKVVIHCLNDKLEIPYVTCEELLKQLDSDLFIQCSRYCIVNIKYIDQIDYANRFIRMMYTDDVIEIGITMKKEFRKKIEHK